jgi:hypothetical protein
VTSPSCAAKDGNIDGAEKGQGGRADMSMSSWGPLSASLSKAFKVMLFAAILLIGLELLFFVVWGAIVFFDGPAPD